MIIAHLKKQVSKQMKTVLNMPTSYVREKQVQTLLLLKIVKETVHPQLQQTQTINRVVTVVVDRTTNMAITLFRAVISTIPTPTTIATSHKVLMDTVVIGLADQTVTKTPVAILATAQGLSRIPLVTSLNVGKAAT